MSLSIWTLLLGASVLTVGTSSGITYFFNESLKLSILNIRDMDEDVVKEPVCDSSESTIETKPNDFTVNLLHMQLTEQSFKKLRKEWIVKWRENWTKERWQEFRGYDCVPPRLPPPLNDVKVMDWLENFQKKKVNSLEDILDEMEEVMTVLAAIDDALDEDPLYLTNVDVEYLHQLQSKTCIELQKKMDFVTCLLLEDMCRYELGTVNVRERCFTVKENKFIDFQIRTFLPVPVAEGTLLRTKSLEFPDMSISVAFPPDLQESLFSFRVMKTNFDHISCHSPSFHFKPLPHDQYIDLSVSLSNEAEKLKEYQKEIERTQMESQSQSSPQVLDSSHVIFSPKGFSSPEDMLVSKENEIEKKLLSRLKPKLVDIKDLNLRDTTSIGGIYHLNLYNVPMLPSFCGQDKHISTFEIRETPSPIPFHVKYVPPPTETHKTRRPEEIEADLRKFESEMEKLVSITVPAPTNVQWFETPFPAIWIEERKSWTVDFIHDVKFNEEKQTLTFRTGLLGWFGLFTKRYNNLPLQSWEMKPERGNIMLRLVGTAVVAEFLIKDHFVCLKSLQNASNDSLDYLLGKYYLPHQLAKKMKNGGLNLFPDHDGCIYVKNSGSKHRPLEKHTYSCMALLSAYYSFLQSKWNAEAGRRGLVMWVKDHFDHGKVEKQITSLKADGKMVHITPCESSFIKCEENSEKFSTESLHPEKIYGDLYNLVYDHTPIQHRNLIAKSKTSHGHQFATVFEMLYRARVFTYS